jgi:hypothetical protein
LIEGTTEVSSSESERERRKTGFPTPPRVGGRGKCIREN